MLLAVFLFNMIGYKLFFYYLQEEADARLQARIERMSDSDKRLLRVAIPIGLPYQTDWKDFESVEGEMTYKGVTYKYVKRKVSRDSLILLCINFHEKNAIEKRSHEYFRKVNDLASQSSKHSVLKQVKDEFFQENKKSYSSLFAIAIAKPIVGNDNKLVLVYPDIPEMPPEHFIYFS